MDFNPNLVSTPRQEGPGQGQSPQYMSSPGWAAGGESGYMSPRLAGPGGVGQHVTSNIQSPQQYSPMLGTGDQPMFSARHDAIYLVVGRVLFHFWNRTLVNSGTVDGPGTPPIVSYSLWKESID